MKSFDKVTLIVSLGPPPDYYTVPNLINVNLKNAKEILTKSYRVPKEVFNIADKIINRVAEHKRVQKTWMPKNQKGFVKVLLGVSKGRKKSDLREYKKQQDWKKEKSRLEKY